VESRSVLTTGGSPVDSSRPASSIFPAVRKRQMRRYTDCTSRQREPAAELRGKGDDGALKIFIG
jgi:hypothetical protein